MRVRLMVGRQTLNLFVGVRFSHPLPNMLGYSNGKRIDCESIYPGSIPGPSTKSRDGRLNGLGHEPFKFGNAGSIPVRRTTILILIL